YLESLKDKSKYGPIDSNPDFISPHLYQIDCSGVKKNRQALHCRNAAVLRSESPKTAHTTA
ncbi:MAG: hypothetical protein ABIF19_04195, partial [Planctomycetota bacterium]